MHPHSGTAAHGRGLEAGAGWGRREGCIPALAWLPSTPCWEAGVGQGWLGGCKAYSPLKFCSRGTEKQVQCKDRCLINIFFDWLMSESGGEGLKGLTPTLSEFGAEAPP